MGGFYYQEIDILHSTITTDNFTAQVNCSCIIQDPNK